MNQALAERMAAFAKRGTFQGYLGRTAQFAIYVRDGMWLAYSDETHTPLAESRTESGLRAILNSLER